METAYLVCAVIGGTVLVIQTLLLVIGGHADTDMDFDGTVDVDVPHDVDVAHDGDMVQDADAAHDAFLKLLSLKTVVAFLTFFGLTGLAGQQAELSGVATLAMSIGAGLIAVYIVAWLMAGLAKLQSRGNLNLGKALGKTAKVYVPIPGERKAGGKVTVSVQGRMVECKAVTEGDGIATGTEVRVVGLSSSDTLEVSA